VNSIEDNMKGMKGFIKVMIENFNKAKEEYISGEQKFWGIFVGLIIVMVFGVNYAMGKLGLI